MQTTSLVCAATSACLSQILSLQQTAQPKLYTDKLAGSVGACMGFVRNGGKGRFVPNTVLEGDIRSMVKGSADRIVITYRKQRGDALYTEIVYTAKKIDWTALTLPEEYQYLPLP